MDTPIPFPAELRPYRTSFDLYLDAKLRQFGTILLRLIGNGLSPDQVRSVIDEAMIAMQQLEAAAAPQRPLRLVIRHDCQSTGCGDQTCVLCQYNPSRLCTRNVKSKYLIDDYLKAKCGAQLRVELVDDTGACHTEGLPAGVRLELHMLNGEKYKELCPDNTLLSTNTLKSCVINYHTKALLKRDGMSDTDLQVFLPLEHGTAKLSDLALTTSSEALLSGKAPTFRLLVWAVKEDGEPVPYVTYVVSESFVVATKRVKGAIKSDIPSVMDGISKLVHIGKATVEKLNDLRMAFQEEGFDFKLPEDLVKVEKVGQFRKLVDLSENNNELKNRLRHVLKLSPEKWEEVCQHAMSAVSPDFRNRVWWYVPLSLGLLYQCKNGAVQLDNPIGVVKAGQGPDVPTQIIQLQQLSPADFSAIPRLKNSAVQNWYMTNHPNWAIFSENEEAVPPATPPGPGPAVAAAAGAGPSNGGAAGVPLMPLGPNLAGVMPAAPYGIPGGPPSPVLGGLTVAGGGGGGAGYAGGMYGQRGVTYGQPEAGAYVGLAEMPMQIAGMSQLPVQAPGGGHRINNSTPFVLQQQPQSQRQRQLSQQQQPSVKVQPAISQQRTGPTVAPSVQDLGGGNVPPAVNGAGSGTSSGLVGGQQAVGVMGAATIHHPPAAGGSGSATSSGATRSPFAADAMMMNIADAFPRFHHMPPNGAGGGGQLAAQDLNGARSVQGGVKGVSDVRHDATERMRRARAGNGVVKDLHAPTGHHLGDGGHGQQAGSMFSLDMLKTDDLMGNGLTLLTGNDTFRSNDWIQQLHGIGGQQSQLGGINSYTMIDVAPPHEAGDAAGDTPGDGDGSAGGAPGAGLTGAQGDVGSGLVGLESERLRSITLDYEKVIADHRGA
ncbi:hypothetical protein VOLCADRAFT_115791 [Volvox carteri f. nagariensis]|uniref:Uncharacterized protein n=1 Tax=Volvox carteri f. nagariensis TaxID=3068 RepID=D8TIB1_VOLCA|nr:uncharacterized protein VOLCADRAFT_115791 [Volvox carteri f. nagariensis]EFJ53210.1 hypothetical protein VOLCADRAFT_115791 [Volvox carteri f. nagariensis]|eukprot:XP_002946215.1 hypothetical protein VOLCADRAFT_115791 [Volvox carteri f. nagariensis]